METSKTINIFRTELFKHLNEVIYKIYKYYHKQIKNNKNIVECEMFYIDPNDSRYELQHLYGKYYIILNDKRQIFINNEFKGELSLLLKSNENLNSLFKTNDVIGKNFDFYNYNLKDETIDFELVKRFKNEILMLYLLTYFKYCEDICCDCNFDDMLTEEFDEDFNNLEKEYLLKRKKEVVELIQNNVINDDINIKNIIDQLIDSYNVNEDIIHIIYKYLNNNYKINITYIKRYEMLILCIDLMLKCINNCNLILENSK